MDSSQALALARELKDLLGRRESASGEEQDHIDRSLRIVEVVEWTLTNTDPSLISDPVLSGLAQHLQGARDQLTQWVGGAGADYLMTHAKAQLDGTLAVLGAVPVAMTAAEASAEIASLRRSVGQHRAQVDREVDALKSASSQAQAEFEKQAQQAANRVSELEAEVARFRDEIGQVTASAREATNQQQNAFTAAQTERQESFGKLLDEKRQETAAAVADLRDQIAVEIKATKERSATDIAQIEQAKSRIEEILGIVGEEALVGTYSKNADKDRGAANGWRWGAVAAIVVSVGIGIWLVAEAHGGNASWQSLAAKAVLVAPIGGVAAYAARQSSEHRHSQREAEHVALQLTALKPYLSDLAEPDKRDQLLSEIALRLFGRPRALKGDGESLETSLADNPTLVGQLLAVLQELNRLRPPS